MDNSNGLTYVITRLIVLTNVLILCMLINSKLVIYIIILILSYLFGLPQLTTAAAARREIFGVNTLRGKLHQLGSPNLQDIFIGG